MSKLDGFIAFFCDFFYIYSLYLPCKVSNFVFSASLFFSLTLFSEVRLAMNVDGLFETPTGIILGVDSFGIGGSIIDNDFCIFFVIFI